MNLSRARGPGGKRLIFCKGVTALHTILFYDVVDDYERRRTMFREEHLTLARESYARGEMVLAGALADPADGAVLVFRGDCPDVAVAFAKADPYVRNGLVAAWRVSTTVL